MSKNDRILVVVSANFVNHQPLENKDKITEIRSC